MNDGSEIEISIDYPNLNLVLRGCANLYRTNRRLSVSFDRLNAEVCEHDILVPYQEKDKIDKLAQIQRILKKFGLSKSLADSVLSDVANYQREEELFKEFSTKAYRIREGIFETGSDIVDDYKNFVSFLDNELVRSLYPRQKLSAFHMAFAQNSCNFSVPGAGKTTIVYAAYAYLRQLPEQDQRHVSKLFVIGPLSSFAPWENQYKDCFGKVINSQRLSGSAEISKDEKQEHLYSGDPAELTLLYHGGIDSLKKEIVDFLKKHRVMLVVDEAHRIKNPDGIWGRSAIEISREATARVVLTGTPAPNGYEDLYNLYQFIYPFRYKNIIEFNYANLSEMSAKQELNTDRVKKFTQNISPFFVRIKKSDLNLPPVKEHLIKVQMNAIQREIYDFIEAEYIKSFSMNDKATVKDILNKARLIRLRQASTNPALLNKPLNYALQENYKLDEVDPNSKFTKCMNFVVDDSEIIQKISEYDTLETPRKFIEVLSILKRLFSEVKAKAIIWTIFIQNAHELAKFLRSKGIETRMLIGSTIQEERESTIEKFNNPKNREFRVIIANPFAVSESISLHHGCHNAIYLERDYNCSNFLQSRDRIHRVGLDDDQLTQYFYVISQESIDEVIDQKLASKVERMESIINQEIPLFGAIDDEDETDMLKALIEDYARRSK